MKRLFSDHWLFLREFWTHYHTTGAILPSGRFLAKALARWVGKGDRPQRILEVGPGTGPITRRIAQAMRPEDQLDLVELNASFVEQLREGFRSDPVLKPVADRSRVLHSAVQDLAGEPAYDVIISGLPLNNFSPALVEQILGTMTGLLRPQGTLSFFQYIYIRQIKSALVGRRHREHLRAVGRVMNALLDAHEFRRDWVWLNMPAAWAHHVRMDGK
jgi:phosphatidylethanolamine/phosphatidyl-N-methylethanolamine N-methyltransferase